MPLPNGFNWVVSGPADLGWEAECLLTDSLRGTQIFGHKLLWATLAWRSHGELAIQSVVNREGRLATIAAWTALVADLCPNACQFGQTGNAVRTTGLALIQQILKAEGV